MLTIDNPGADGLFGQRKARIHGYQGATASDLDLVGFDVEILANGTRRFWLVNRRPPVNAKGELTDAFKTGDNATIEVFDAEKSGLDLNHVRRIFDPAIWSPNKPAAGGDGSVLVTNDVSSNGKLFLHQADDLIYSKGYN